MKTPIYKATRIKIRKTGLINAFKAQLLSANNLYNIGIFIIRNMLFSFGDKVLKTELHGNQMRVINLVNNLINIINAKRTTKKVLNPEYKPKLFNPIDSNSTSPLVILDNALLSMYFVITRTKNRRCILHYRQLFPNKLELH